MNYLIPDPKLQELNVIVGNQGGVIPSQVSDALAALDVALKKGDKKEAQKQYNLAVEANKLNGAAWSNVQEWHDEVKNEFQTEAGAGGAGGGTVPGPPAIPGNAIQMFDTGGGMLKTQEGGNVAIQGKNYGAHVKGGQGSTGPVYHFQGDMDAVTMVSMSCDGKKIAFSVTDAPADPGEPYNSNTAYENSYKKGQYVNFRIGEGGYYEDTTALFSIS